MVMMVTTWIRVHLLCHLLYHPTASNLGTVLFCTFASEFNHASIVSHCDWLTHDYYFLPFSAIFIIIISWAIYARKHFPKDIPVDRVSHILYAFANITPDTGEIILSDKWSDTVSRFSRVSIHVFLFFFFSNIEIIGHSIGGRQLERSGIIP